MIFNSKITIWAKRQQKLVKLARTETADPIQRTKAVKLYFVLNKMITNEFMNRPYDSGRNVGNYEQKLKT